jgi:hypothetical protein
MDPEPADRFSRPRFGEQGGGPDRAPDDDRVLRLEVRAELRVRLVLVPGDARRDRRRRPGCELEHAPEERAGTVGRGHLRGLRTPLRRRRHAVRQREVAEQGTKRPIDRGDQLDHRLAEGVVLPEEGRLDRAGVVAEEHDEARLPPGCLGVRFEPVEEFDDAANRLLQVAETILPARGDHRSIERVGRVGREPVDRPGDAARTRDQQLADQVRVVAGPGHAPGEDLERVARDVERDLARETAGDHQDHRRATFAVPEIGEGRDVGIVIPGPLVAPCRDRFGDLRAGDLPPLGERLRLMADLGPARPERHVSRRRAGSA